ncbi:MAG: 50S ribosomal protein L28 [Anaerolineae bacterium]|nr:50S ribosomal protein L28 [Anaerolineae bacterium]
MAICQMCGKSRQYGHNVSFSKRRTNRDWKPNVRRATVTVNGSEKRINVCMKCLKTLRKTA